MTLRQLFWMAEGQGRERWAHTSLLCTLLANANRDPKKTRPFKPADFDPYSRRERRPMSGGNHLPLKHLREALEARKG